jgi:alpha-amylase/alpha-mannosidase (GH57 family)
MKTVTFCFATHNHQPIGNFDSVFEEAFEKSYKPFFEIAKSHSVKFATHFSGILLEWLATHRPEYIALLKGLVSNGNLEIIGGGYYEPILAVISDHDKAAQIAKLTGSIKQLLDYEPSGLWLAERVWEQQLAAPLANSGSKYVILDDTHFRAAGLTDSDLTGYYLTEDQGKTIAVFPISKELRYTIPFQSVDETIAVLKEAASESGDSVVTFADDGEKFGVWPRTYEHVYGEGWLEEFFAKLEEQSSWIRTMHFSETIKQHKPKGRIYLPNASYAEMMEWALPTAATMLNYEAFLSVLNGDKGKYDKYTQFVRGGFWRNFFVKYPESNHLHKRMQEVSKRCEALQFPQPAYDHLLAAQCNDPYWHGVFGGIYLPNLRHEVYKNLITAERELDEAEKKSVISVSQKDFNCDGTNDAIIESDKFIIAFDPSRGGAISELSFKSKSFNLTNFINRIPEASHEKVKSAAAGTNNDNAASIHDIVIAKEEGLEKQLRYDWYRHGCFIEHFLSKDATLDDFASQQFLEFGDFFKSTIIPKVTSSDTEVKLEFENEGNVVHSVANKESHKILLTKTITATCGSGDLKIEYEIRNNSDKPIDIRFGSEWTFGLLAGGAHDRYFESPGVALSDVDKQLRSKGEIVGANKLSLIDEWGGYTIELDMAEPCTFWRAPIETVASSEAGFERVYQGSIIVGVWSFALAPQENRSLGMVLRVLERQ